VPGTGGRYASTVYAGNQAINEPEYSPGAYWHGSERPSLPAEEQLIDEIFARYGHMTRWQLRDFSHTLPEWQDPQGSSRRIDPADILRSAGYSDEAIDDIAAELEESVLADSIFR